MALGSIRDVISMSSFITARQAEIKSVVGLLEDCDHGKRAFQTLPRHMQRRRVSSDPRRLPHYLRERHKREGGNNAKITRRPSRKYRRRPRLLLQEYNRRQKEHVWLETHIWHAKRFHMIRRWGYALANSSTHKGYRSSVRAAKTSCLAQDVSYMCCIELEGNSTELVTGLSRITQPWDLSLITAAETYQGSQWERVTLFKPDMQPYGALGDVDIIWLPTMTNHPDKSAENARIWVWSHPSAHSHIVQAMIDIYNLVKVNATSDINSSDSKNLTCDVKRFADGAEEKDAFLDADTTDTKSIIDEVSPGRKPSNEYSYQHQDVFDTEGKIGNSLKRRNMSPDDCTVKKFKDVNGLKLALKNVPFERTPKFCNSSSMKMTLLKDTLCRIRLTGPEAVSVLKAAFIPANLYVDNIEAKCIPDNGSVGSCKWWIEYYQDEEKRKGHDSQVIGWQGLTSSHLKKRMVLPLTIRDPRTTLPKKKTPIKQDKDSVECIYKTCWPVESPLYSSKVRDKISLSKDPDLEVNKRRADLLIPGSNLPETPEESKLPVILLSRPCTHAVGYGAGLDVIVPSGWGMSVWLPIVLNGGVAAGQQAEANLFMEFLTPLTPNLLPDTESGSNYSDVIGLERRVDYFKRPPSCRHNFIKLGVQYPFSSPWLKLVQDWSKGIQSLYVLRNHDILKYLASLIGDAFDIVRRNESLPKHTKGVVSSNIPSEFADEIKCLKGKNEVNKKIEKTNGLEKETKYEDLQQSGVGSLVRVKIILDEKGSVEPCAMICLPQVECIKEKIKTEMIEPIKVDNQHDQRMELKREHSRIKRRISAMKMKTKEKVDRELSTKSLQLSGGMLRKVSDVALQDLENDNKEIFTKHRLYNSDMEELWLMRRDLELQCCSLQIIGYITHGSFSMTIGRGAGIGWVALKPLLDYMELHEKLRSNNDASTDIKVNSVLIRNPSSLKYFWGKIFIVR